MDQIAAYLEKLGYEVEDQGKIKHFLIVLKDGLPIGFILPDFTVKMVAGEDTQKYDMLQHIVSFVRVNQHLQTAGQGTAEYVVTTYRGSQLTTFFDLEAGHERFAFYIVNSSGEVPEVAPTFDSYDDAIRDFILQTGMIDLTAITGKEPFHIRWRRHLANRLMKGM